jgi:hypothetical protein
MSVYGPKPGGGAELERCPDFLRDQQGCPHVFAWGGRVALTPAFFEMENGGTNSGVPFSRGTQSLGRFFVRRRVREISSPSSNPPT